MAWTLEIHHIDVQQGDATLIVARDPTQPNEAHRRRSLLIDAGYPQYGLVVHEYLEEHLPGKLDAILLSHYDNDHQGGITEILTADTRSVLATTLATTGFNAANDYNHYGQVIRVAATSAAITAAALGAYDDNELLTEIGTAVVTSNPPVPFENTVLHGINIANNRVRLRGTYNSATIPTYNPYNPGNIHPYIVAVSRSGTIAAETAINAGGNVYALMFETILQWLYNNTGGFVNENGGGEYNGFNTQGKYSKTILFDQGDCPKGQIQVPPSYLAALKGHVMYKNGKLGVVDHAVREQIHPGIGTEILWRGVGKPDGAPTIWVVAGCQRVRNQNDITNGGNIRNNSGLACLVKFNTFLYYTGGDMESLLEDKIIYDIRSAPLDGDAPATHVCAFKCGHHGSYNSTSQYFLNGLRSSAAFISTGSQSHSHPAQAAINLIHNDGTIQNFYLTNCRIGVQNVAATLHGGQQWAPNNKSRLCGRHVGPDQYRGGHAKLIVTQENSLSDNHDPHGGGPKHQFSVEYYDAYPSNVIWGPGVVNRPHIH